jgi:hypothetical protein
MSLEILNTKIELEKRLSTAFPTTPISYPSVAFTPSASTYLRCQLFVGKPDDPVIGVKYRRENMTFQVFVVCQHNKGEAEAFTIAQQISELYARGTSIQVSNLLIQIFRSPHISGSMIVDNRLVVPVMIQVVVQVFN